MFGSPASSKPVNKRYWIHRAALLLALLVSATQAAAASSANAADWLEKVAKSARNLTYEGVFVYQHQGSIEAMRIFHRADEKGISERLFSLTGTPREIVRDNENVICILPDSRSVLVDRRSTNNPISQLVPKDVEHLSTSYSLNMVGEGRVADRDAVKIGIDPKDAYRFGYRLWIDRQSGLLLQADVFDESGDPIEQLMFTVLRLPESIPDEMLQPQMPADDFTWYREQPLSASAGVASKLIFNDLPPGFELVTHELRRIPGSERAVEHLLFSDGLASVSAYLEKGGAGEAFKGHSAMGAVRAYGRILNETTQITVVGEVPAVTVERIGEAIEAAD